MGFGLIVYTCHINYTGGVSERVNFANTSHLKTIAVNGEKIMK